MVVQRALRLGRAACLLLLGGCAMSGRDEAAQFIAYMDAQPQEKRVPNWEATRALMLREAPKVGDPAPDFTLERRDGTGAVSLSQFQGQRPVVLIFGSWT